MPCVRSNHVVIHVAVGGYQHKKIISKTIKTNLIANNKSKLKVNKQQVTNNKNNTRTIIPINPAKAENWGLHNYFLGTIVLHFSICACDPGRVFTLAQPEIPRRSPTQVFVFPPFFPIYIRRGCSGCERVAGHAPVAGRARVAGSR